MTRRERLQKATTRADAATILAAVAAAKRGSSEGRLQLTALMTWVAYSCPDATTAVCDAISSAWLGTGGPALEVPMGLPEAPLEDSFWQAFWAVVDGNDDGYDALTITVAVASLAAAAHPLLGEIADNHARSHKGAAEAIKKPVPGHTDIKALAQCPQGSLGQSLHTMIIDNGYDPEVLDRESIALS